MKYTMFLLAAFLFIACNSNKKENSITESNIDTTTTHDIVTGPDPTINMSGDTANVSSNRLIVPGKSIGLTSLGQDADEASKHLGPPAMEDAAMGKYLDAWYTIKGKDTVSEVEIFFI